MIGTGMGLLIGGLAAGGASAYGAHRASKANEKAAEISDKANTEALAFEREKEATRKAEWDRMMAEEEARWDAEQERLAPYRAASEGALAQLVSLAGLPAYTPTPVEKPNFNRPMPKDWQPGDPTGLEETMAEGQATVRAPRSAKLTELLGDTLGSRDMAYRPERDAAMPEYGPVRPGTEPMPEPLAAARTGVSDVAYQRITDRGAPIQSLVRGRMPARRRSYGEPA